jgi:methyltransferase (TIGR00027 family)
MRRNRPSLTAVKVSRILLYLQGDPELSPLLPRGAAEATERLLIAAGAMQPWMVRFYQHPAARRLLAWLEQHTDPGTVWHLGLRKRFFDDETRRAIAEGARQVLVLGGGFDTLSMRLSAEYPDVRFVDLDHPVTHAAKRRGMERLGIRRPNLLLCGMDLSAIPLDEALAGVKGWSVDEKTVVLAEGLLMYLDPAAVSALLEAIRRATKVGSRILWSYLKADDKGQPLFGAFGRLSRLSLRVMGEPLLWAVREGELGTFLEAHAYRLDMSPERCDLRRRYLEPAGLGDRPAGSIEFMAIADSTFRADS